MRNEPPRSFTDATPPHDASAMVKPPLYAASPYTTVAGACASERKVTVPGDVVTPFVLMMPMLAVLVTAGADGTPATSGKA